MGEISRITTSPKVASGKPVIKGTRIAVEFVLDLLSSGWGVEQILVEYSNLKKEDVLACISYAKNIVGEWKSYPLKIAVG